MPAICETVTIIESAKLYHQETTKQRIRRRTPR